MRKIISKIAGLMLGLSLAVGVGVTVSGVNSKIETRAESGTWTASSQGFSDQQQLGGNTYSFTDSNISVSFSEASGNGHKYYNNGTAVRSYGGNSFTVSCSAGNLTSITLSNNQGKEVDADVGTYSANSWTGNSSSVTFTVQSGSGNFRTSTITAVYTTGGGGESDPVLQSIAVSGEKTEYNVGDEFVKPTVTATYDKGDPQDVTSSATFSGYNMGVAGEYTITVSYGGKTAEYSITVNAAEASGDVLYSCNFTDVETHSYTQNKTFTLNEKAWTASVSQVSGGVFFLGCNSGNAAKGILNDNSTFADIVAALKANDSPYNSGYTTAHAYALLFDNAYDNVATVEFAWAGGNNAFQVYLFGDKGSGFELLGSTNYATSGQAVSGNVVWNASGNGENFSSFAIVARPGATGSTATNKTLRAASFQIIAGESVDPSLGTMVIKTSGNPADGSSLYYSKNAGTHVFSAYDESVLVSGVTWSVSDEKVATINSSTGAVTTLKPGDVTIFAEAEGYNKASAAVHFIKGALEEIAVTGSMSKTSYTTNDSWNNAGLVATGTYYSGWTEDISSTAVWTYSPASPAQEVTSVVATATLDEISGSSSVQTVSVTVAHAGTAADPFTVAEGIAKAQAIGNKSGGEGPWVTSGKISSIVQVLTSGFQNARFYITEDGTTSSPSIYAYDCKYLENAGFTEETAASIVVGATVTITGNLLNYNNNTPEYARGCYLLDIQAPETGDVDVTFNPASTSFEIGASGTFTASSETSGAKFTWSVDHSSILSVNENSGAYEALSIGVARVTVTASAGGKEGTAFVDFVVNGSAGSYYSVSEANTIASGVASGQTTAYYIYVEGFVKEFATSMSGTSPRALDIMTLDETSSIMVYTNVNPYADFISGLNLGDRIVVKGKIQNYSGKYEIVEPEKVASNASAISFALDFITQTDAVCTGYDGVTDNGDALDAIWEGLYSSYNALFDNQKSILMGAERNESGTHVEQAAARYDYLVGKYKLDNFITGRTPIVVAGAQFVQTSTNSNTSTIIIVIVALTSITSIGVLLVIKRKRSLVK